MSTHAGTRWLPWPGKEAVAGTCTFLVLLFLSFSTYRHSHVWLPPFPPAHTHTQVQRMEHALRAVEATLYGMRKPHRLLERASLDVVSISQLQAAVDSFAAVGDVSALMMPGDEM